MGTNIDSYLESKRVQAITYDYDVIFLHSNPLLWQPSGLARCGLVRKIERHRFWLKHSLVSAQSLLRF